MIKLPEQLTRRLIYHGYNVVVGIYQIKKLLTLWFNNLILLFFAKGL